MSIAVSQSENTVLPQSSAGWLKRYYGVRALFSVVWVALAVTIGKAQPSIGAVLLVAYPLWDCLANYVDAARNGGLRINPTQALNAVTSAVVTLAVAVALGRDVHAAIGVLGIWATVSGIFQFLTGVRRWRSAAAAQWPQILSGAQSCAGGTHFVLQALDPVAAVSVATIAPYAAFGALYFAISSGVLAVKSPE